MVAALQDVVAEVVGAWVVVITVGAGSTADTIGALVSNGARHAIVADRAIGLGSVAAAGGRQAEVQGAGVGVVAVHGWAVDTVTGRADIVLRAFIVIDA